MPKHFFWSVAPMGIVVRVVLLVAVATMTTHVHAQTTGAAPLTMPSVGAVGLLLVGLGLIVSAWRQPGSTWRTVVGWAAIASSFPLWAGVGGLYRGPALGLTVLVLAALTRAPAAISRVRHRERAVRRS